MKHTHSRKKMLLSSIAMLLVALVALGSATYAWFVANPNAYAQGISMKTTAAAGLVVRTDSDSTWSHEASLYKDQAANAKINLDPASQVQSSPATFWTVDAADADDEAAADVNMTSADVRSWTAMASGSTPGTLAAAGSVYAEKIYFRLTDGSNPADATGKEVKIKGVTITANSNASSIKNAVRVAIADKNGALLGTWALATDKAQGTLAPAGSGDNTPGAQGNFDPALAVQAATFSTAVGTGYAGNSLSASDSDYSNFITVYVYLDGQDQNCYSSKVTTQDAAELIQSIKVDCTLA